MSTLSEQESSSELNVDQLLLIVVGAHLRAEIEHRPIAMALQAAMQQQLSTISPASSLMAVVCTDVWYLNNEELLSRPTISVGGPELNALTAFFGDKLPMAMVVDDEFMVQLDVGYGELLASCWGREPAATARACDVMIERYLGGFLQAACRAEG